MRITRRAFAARLELTFGSHGAPFAAVAITAFAVPTLPIAAIETVPPVAVAAVEPVVAIAAEAFAAVPTVAVVVSFVTPLIVATLVLTPLLVTAMLVVAPLVRAPLVIGPRPVTAVAIVALVAITAPIAALVTAVPIILLLIPVTRLGGEGLATLRTVLAGLGLLEQAQDPVVVLRVLIIALREHTISGRRRVASQVQVLLVYLTGVAADADVGSVAVEGLVAVRRVRPAVTATASTLLVWALSHYLSRVLLSGSEHLVRSRHP